MEPGLSKPSGKAPRPFCGSCAKGWEPRISRCARNFGLLVLPPICYYPLPLLLFTPVVKSDLGDVFFRLIGIGPVFFSLQSRRVCIIVLLVDISPNSVCPMTPRFTLIGGAIHREQSHALPRRLCEGVPKVFGQDGQHPLE